MSLSHLRCFVAVVEAGSFAGAARRLGLTNSGVSKAIARLEATQGLRLLNRSTHSVSPTEAGELLVGPARAVLARAAEVVAILSHETTAPAAGSVRIGAPPAFVRRCLVPLLPALAARHPGITLDVRASDAFVDLAEAGLDLVIRSGTLDAFPAHIRVPSFEFDWVACASPGYVERHGAPSVPADLVGHRLVGFRNARTGLVEPWRPRDDAFPRAPSWRFVTDDAESVLLAALDTIGIMWGPIWLVEVPLASGSAVKVLPDWRPDTMPMSILRRGQSLLPARVRAVMTFLVEHRAAKRAGELG